MGVYRFGKKAKRLDTRTLLFDTYRTPALPTPPPGHSSLTRVEMALATTNVGALFPMDHNDTEGDCTLAGAAHADTVFNGLVAVKSITPADVVLSDYLGLTGGQDTGLDCLTVLNWWRQTGLNGKKILAFAELNPAHHTDVMLACLLFGGVYLGFQVPANCIAQFDAGQPWTSPADGGGALTGDGHCVFALAYNAVAGEPVGLRVLTWGSSQLATWGWWDAVVDEAYCILPPEATDPAFAPGFNLAQLQTDLAAVTG